MPDLALISLFAGVGGFDLAAKNLGIPTIAAVEIDDQARGVLAHRFPATRLYTDVAQVTGKELLGNHEGPVIVTGGFPCQDLSVAGKRAGLAGQRSGLFWEIVRLAEELQPTALLLENVPGLLSSNGGRDMGIVVGALGELGYRVGWRVLDAQHFGVPQRRRRVFIIAGRFGTDTLAQILFESESGGGNLASSNQTGQDVAGTVAGGVGGSGEVAPTLTAYNLDPRSPQSEEEQRIVSAVFDAERVFGQAGYGTYAPGVKTLNASMVKRPEDTVVIGD